MGWMMFAAVCAYFVKGLCGFANTLVFSTILSFSTNNVNISPVELVLGLPSNIMISYKERKSVQWKVCLPLAGLVLLGDIPGILLLKNTNTQVIKGIFGFVIIAIGVEMLLREYMGKTKKSQLLLITIGILSGILCGLYGIGALLAAYMGRVTDNSSSFKGNLCIVFLIDNLFRLVMYGVTGIITLATLKQSVILFPFMALGLFLGMKGSSFLDEKKIKKLVIIMLILSGVSLIVTLF
ncbi:MAG: sulfite exporter TauE/SafE family protein [Lachnospiraceae bacterium]|jgi:hypothetical protein|nr:predicted permeases [Roseburia sp. CAG:100]